MLYMRVFMSPHINVVYMEHIGVHNFEMFQLIHSFLELHHYRPNDPCIVAIRACDEFIAIKLNQQHQPLFVHKCG